MAYHFRLGTTFLGVLALLFSFAVHAAARPELDKKLTPLSFNSNDPDFDDKINVERWQLKCATGPCIVLRKTQRLLKPGNIEQFEKFLEAAKVTVIEGSDNPWATNFEGKPWKKGDRANPRFNCHSFSLGNHVGITPDDWVEGLKGKATEDTNPMEVFLASYFTMVKKLDPSKQKPEDVEKDPDLKEGDILLLTGRDPEGKRPTFHSHSGRIVKRGDKWQLMAKMGEDFPVVVGPILAVCSPYLRMFNEVTVWRVK